MRAADPALRPVRRPAARRCCSSTRSTGPTTSSRRCCSRRSARGRSPCPSSARSPRQRPPIVVLTSNRSRELHDALRRRCLYHWLEYPEPAAGGRDPAPHRARRPSVAADRVRRPVRRPRARRSTWTSRPGSPRRSTGSRRCRRSAPPSWSREVVVPTLGALAKTPDDRDAGRRVARDATRSADRDRPRTTAPCSAASTGPRSSPRSAQRLRAAGVPVEPDRDDRVQPTRWPRRHPARGAPRSTGWPGSPWSTGSRTSRCSTGSSTRSFGDAVLAVDPHARRTGAGRRAGRRRRAGARAGGSRPRRRRRRRRPALAHAAARPSRRRRSARTAALLPELLPSAVARIADTPFDELDARRAGGCSAAGSRSRSHRWPTRRSRRHAGASVGRPGGAAGDDRRVPAYRLGADGAPALPTRCAGR